MLGLVCALWTAQQFFHYEMDPSTAALYNFSVSDEEVSLEFGTDSYLCYVSGYSWRETIFT